MKFEQQDIIKIKSLSDFRKALINAGYDKEDSIQITNIYEKVESQHYKRHKKDFFGDKLHGILHTDTQVLKSDFQAVPLQNEAIRYMAFIGLKSKRSPQDTAKYIRAVKLEKEGVPMNKIYLQTGWYKSIYDEKWKMEISDRESKVRYEVVTENKLSKSNVASKFGNRGEIDPRTKYFVLKEDGFKFRNLLDHPLLYKYYPEFAEYNVEGFFLGQGIDRNAYFDIQNKTIFVSDWDEKSAIKSVMHEVQHAIQRLEGFSLGNNLILGLLIKEKGINWTNEMVSMDKEIRENIDGTSDSSYLTTVQIYNNGILYFLSNFDKGTDGKSMNLNHHAEVIKKKYYEAIIERKSSINNSDIVKQMLFDLIKLRYYIKEEIFGDELQVLIEDISDENKQAIINLYTHISEYIRIIIAPFNDRITDFTDYVTLQSLGRQMMSYTNAGSFPTKEMYEMYKEAFKVYENTAGEIESRLVEERLEFDELKRKLSYPLKSTPDKSEVTVKFFQTSDVAVYVRGATQFDKNQRALMYFTQDKNITTPIHELGHILEKCLTTNEKSKVDSWLTTQKPNLQPDAFAMGFEKYIMSSSNVSKKLKAEINAQYPSKLREIVLTDDIKRVYKSLTGI